jgi:hypothetical protein
MMKDATDKLRLESLARRLETDPRFMAYALALYRRQEGLEVEELAQYLGLIPEMMARMALCLLPDTRSPLFAEQVREIADYTLADEAQLANLLRQVSGLEKLERISQTTTTDSAGEASVPLMAGLLAVARDHDEEEEAQTPPDEPAKPPMEPEDH